jgi:hypothetical protein
MKRVALVLVLLAAAAAAVIAANIALLGAATSGSEPVGTVSPRIALPHAHRPAVRTITTTQPTGADHEDD